MDDKHSQFRIDNWTRELRQRPDKAATGTALLDSLRTALAGSSNSSQLADALNRVFEKYHNTAQGSAWGGVVATVHGDVVRVYLGHIALPSDVWHWELLPSGEPGGWLAREEGGSHLNTVPDVCLAYDIVHGWP